MAIFCDFASLLATRTEPLIFWSESTFPIFRRTVIKGEILTPKVAQTGKVL